MLKILSKFSNNIKRACLPSHLRTYATSFKVDDVEPNKKPIEHRRQYWQTYEEALMSLLPKEYRLERLYKEGDNDRILPFLKDGIRGRALMNAVGYAYRGHYPLILSPDAIWLTIGEGIVRSIQKEPEKFQLIEERVTTDMTIEDDSLLMGSPENDWARVCKQFVELIRTNIGDDMYELLLNDFSTTSGIDKFISEIGIMHIASPVRSFTAITDCGIPEIILQGTVDDWKKIRSKIEVLRKFQLDWWIDKLSKVMDEFVNAAENKVNTEFWRMMFKETKGHHLVDGWLNVLTPFIQVNDEFIVNPKMEWEKEVEDVEGSYPSGLARVPFTWKCRKNEKDFLSMNMEVVGGFIGCIQEEENNAVRPEMAVAIVHTGKERDIPVLLYRRSY